MQKMFRRALMGSAAIAVMTSYAHADELSALKAELDMLKSKVNSMETAPAAPSNGGWLSWERGSGSNANFGPISAQDAANISDENGYTIAITPSADMPAPVAEITVYGYVKGDVIYDFDRKHGNAFDVTAMRKDQSEYAICSNNNLCNDSDDANDFFDGTLSLNAEGFNNYGINKYTRKGFAASGDEGWTLHAKQSRFGIRSKIDTAVGQIRTKIEGDFYGAAGNDFRLREAWGEWDMTPNWTFGAGQTYSAGVLLPIGISTVDFSGPAGPAYGRVAQVRLSYMTGPLSWAVSLESPTYSSTELPNIASYISYDIAGGHSLIATGAIADWNNGDVPSRKSCALQTTYTDVDGDGADFDDVYPMDVVCSLASYGSWQPHQDKLGWMVAGGANINLADVASLTGGVVYGEGLVTKYIQQQDFAAVDGSGNPTEALGFTVGLSFAPTETTTFNVGYGYVENLESNPTNSGFYSATETKRVRTVHGNIMWQPVKQMRMGWEMMWGQMEQYNGEKADSLRAQFGTWFFF